MNERIVAAGLLIALAAASRALYDHSGRRYAEGKQAPLPSPRGFRAVYAWVRLSTLVAGPGALLSEHPLWLVLHRERTLLWSGLALSVLGFGLFAWAKRCLGRQYSPCFDAWAPTAIVAAGAYARVRHPIYTANLALLAGLALATGSAWLVVNLALVAWFYVRSARTEEAELAGLYPEYAAYVRRTGRFLPRLARRAA